MLSLALSAVGRGAPTAEEVKRAAASCDGGLGADGYLITLKRATGDAFAADVERKWEGRRKLQQEESAENKMLFTYSSSRVFRGVAARLDDSELQDVLDNEEVDHIAPNCVMQLSPEETKQAITDEALANGRSVTTSSYTEYQASPPSWGLDRIDSREGLDGNYTFGSATGVSETGPVVVYVLDTGIRVSHNDFGGRAKPGWSAGCPTGTEYACGGSWEYKGSIGTGCSGHGTHIAATIAGTECTAAPRQSHDMLPLYFRSPSCTIDLSCVPRWCRQGCNSGGSASVRLLWESQCRRLDRWHCVGSRRGGEDRRSRGHLHVARWRHFSSLLGSGSSASCRS